jgi:hypothetical protein
MFDQRLILAWFFRLSGLGIGLPALGILGQIGMAYVTTTLAPASAPADIRTYGLVGLLIYGVRGIATVMGFLINLVSGALTVMAVMACCLAALLFCIGGGIDKGALWARVTGLLFSLACLCLWLGVAAATQGTPRAVAAGGSAIALWAIWVLWWHFR